jgi:beta-1,2-mannobiose phosphorylase / 1,2-beta-oligomannan phosphorylase
MTVVTRFVGNPILSPNRKHPWESEAAFNGCPVIGDDGCHLLYRAQSSVQTIHGKTLELSTIGHATSVDRVNFSNRKLLIQPEHRWEQYGCEDPRVTRFGDTYYIFYTAIADWPPAPNGISVAVAAKSNFHTIK